MARTFQLFMAVIQPGPPACEWVNRIAGPVFSSTAATPSETTARSNGPVLGVTERKNWSSVASPFGNWLPPKYFGQRPIRNWLNHI